MYSSARQEAVDISLSEKSRERLWIFLKGMMCLYVFQQGLGKVSAMEFFQKFLIWLMELHQDQ